MKKIFDFFLFSSIYIALCAVVMSYQTFALFNLSVNPAFLFFVFFGTLCSYNFHWYFTPEPAEHSEKNNWSYRNKKIHRVLFFISVAGAGYFCYRLSQYWLWLAIIVLITFLYSAPKLPYTPFSHLKKIAIGKTIFLALAWTYVTSFLPALISGAKWTSGLEGYVVNRFFFIYAVCILFDYRDRHEDTREGIRSMVTHLTEKGINTIFWGSLVAFFLTIIFLKIVYFTFLQSLILALPAIILAFLYHPSKRNTSDYHFYFLLDGLLMLSGLLFLLLSFK